MAGESESTEADICADARQLLDGGRPAEAISLLTAALQNRPQAQSLLAGLGEVLCRSGQFAQAAQHLEKVVAADSNNAANLFYYGVALQGLGSLKPAIIHLRRALDLQPQLTEAYRALSMALWGVAPEHAIATLDEARRKNAATGQTEGLCFFFRQTLADWSVFDDSINWLRTQLDAGATDLEPAICCIVPGFGPAEQRRVAEAYGRMIGGAGARPTLDAREGDKIRIGYLSADLGEHPVGRLMAGILEHHDRNRFEVFAYSTRPGGDLPTTRRLRAAAQHFVDVHHLSDADAVARIGSDSIELLVDLSCYTEGGRPRIVAQRPAPIQINYLGMGGTTGHPAYDYILTDEVLTPPTLLAHYSETPAFLPEVYLNIDQAAAPPQRNHDRARWSLPEKGFVFCAFNNTVKITPSHFHLWMEILQAVPDSVLWLRDYHPGARQRIAGEAERAGVNPQRIVFAPGAERAEHLMRLAHADLLLDCFPYNGGSTTADALWSGLPVLTQVGDTYVSRMSASMVRALDLHELAVDDREAYKSQAIRLATQPATIADLRARLTMRRTTSALFDSARFTGQLEAIFEEMARRSRRGLPATAPIR